MRKEENNMAEECIILFNKAAYDMLRKRFNNCKIYLDYKDDMLHITIKFNNGLAYAYTVKDLLGEIFNGLQAYQLVNAITKGCKQEIMKYYFH